MRKFFVTTAPIALLLFTVVTVFSQTEQGAATPRTRAEILKEIENKRTELAALEKLFLDPTAEDRVAYAEFLRQPQTGLIRILPREAFESEVYKENKQSLVMRGGGSYYSFTSGNHEYSSTTEIGLERGYLSSGFAGTNYGMLISLGDVPLESVSLQTHAANILASHKAASEVPQARIEQDRTSKGATIDGVTVKSRQPLAANSTYVVRAVNYHASDALVAFKVIRIDDDGSAIILWKLLQKYPVPELARNK